MERCSVREAPVKLQAWFEIGERQPSSLEQGEDAIKATVVWPGIYSDQDGALFEVITTAISAEDFEALVVYRELFGDYRFWVATIQNFAGADSRFTLVKVL
jgi:hypothetical protein